jgi:hypothetical protein
MRSRKFFNLQVPVTKELRSVEDSKEPMLIDNFILDTGRRKIVGGPRFEKMGIDSWHI